MDSKLRVIGVAYDGSSESDRALDLAAELATEAGATLQLIGVFERHPVPAPVGLTSMYAVPASAAACRDELLHKLEEAADALPRQLRPAIVLVNGDPAEQLVKRSAPLSLLVIGSHGYGAVRRALFGSVSARVLREAECPVLVVPRRAEARTAA